MLHYLNRFHSLFKFCTFILTLLFFYLFISQKQFSCLIFWLCFYWFYFSFFIYYAVNIDDISVCFSSSPHCLLILSYQLSRVMIYIITIIFWFKTRYYWNGLRFVFTFVHLKVLYLNQIHFELLVLNFELSMCYWFLTYKSLID